MKSGIRFISILSLVSMGAIMMQTSIALADCAGDGRPFTTKLSIKSCEKIVAENNTVVQENIPDIAKNAFLKKLYTGALIKVGGDWLVMYPSTSQDPCKQFRPNTIVTKKAGRACCDTGKWGKCAFGGTFIWDLNAKNINTFQ
jgi:hypothetical protein